MTAPADLPALLQRAAQALPNRVAFVGPRRAAVQLAGEERGVYFGHPASHVWLEYACREECDARGWVWHSHPHRSFVETPSGFFDSEAPTPAHALLAALLSAVEAQA